MVMSDSRCLLQMIIRIGNPTQSLPTRYKETGPDRTRHDEWLVVVDNMIGGTIPRGVHCSRYVVGPTMETNKPVEDRTT